MTQISKMVGDECVFVGPKARLTLSFALGNDYLKLVTTPTF